MRPPYLDEDAVTSVWEYSNGVKPRPKPKKRKCVRKHKLEEQQSTQHHRLMRQALIKPSATVHSPKSLLPNEQRINEQQDYSSQSSTPSTDNDSKAHITLQLDNQPYAPEQQAVSMHQDVQSVDSRWTNSLTLESPSVSQCYYEQPAPQDHSWPPVSNVQIQDFDMQQQPIHYEQHLVSRYHSFDGGGVDFGTPVTNTAMVSQDLTSASYRSASSAPNGLNPGWNPDYMTNTSSTIALQPSVSPAMTSPTHQGLPIQLAVTERVIPEQTQRQQMVFAAQWDQTPHWDPTPAAYPTPNHFQSS
jgi:hypothetical protein